MSEIYSSSALVMGDLKQVLVRIVVLIYVLMMR